MKNLFLVPIIMVLVASLILVSCTEPVATTPTQTIPLATTPAPTAATSPKYGGTVRIIANPIPLNIGWPADMQVPIMTIQCCTETLLRGDNKGNIIPWLAESYKLSDDRKSVTFNLRSGVKFHDGSDFNAEVAKWNLDNYINAKMQPYWASVDIIDGYTIRLNFTQWQNTTLATLVEPTFPAFMISKVAFDKNGMDWVRANPVGTGPFKFASYEPDVSFKVVKNPDYWVKDKPYLEGIDFILIADTATQKMVMKAGEADIGTAALQDMAEYTAKGYTVTIIPLANDSLIPDTANADSPWANQKVREAVEYAIDREAIAKAFGYGYLQAPYQIPPRSTSAYNPDFTLGRKYNPEKSKQLLAEADYPNGFKTTFKLIPGADKNITVAVQADLAKVGIQIDLDYTEMASWINYLGSNASWNNAAIYMGIYAIDLDYAQGLQFLFNMIGKSWQRTPELMQAYQAALDSPDIDVKLIRAVTDMITKDASLIPIGESGGSGGVEAPYVMDTGNNKRSNQMLWNTEDVWLNK